MKNYTLILVAVLVTSFGFAQKKEKVKGSKMVTIEQKTVESFDALEIQDDLEVSLIRGDKNAIELEADDNLQDALSIQRNGGILILGMAKDISSFKKFAVRVTYDGSFKSIVAKDKSKINALEELQLDEINIKGLGNSKLYLNIGSKAVTLSIDEKSYAEINVKAESVNIDLSKNAELKALISSTEMKCDLYQKSKAVIEGDVIDLKLRLDNNSSFTGNKLTAKNTLLTAEGYSFCSVFSETTIGIEASGNAEINLFGEPKVDLKKFSDSARLYKRPLK